MIKQILAHKVIIALAAAVIVGGGTTGGVVLVSHAFSGIASPTLVQEADTNGSATISWTAPITGAVTGYRVSLIPTYTDRVPAPNLGPNGGVVSDLLPATARAHTFSGLLEDCHQRYEMTVQTVTASGPSPPVTTQSFRPSGHVAQGQAPPYVVVLVDGILSQSPGFTMNPYQPMKDGVQSYCPESWWAASNDHADTEEAPNADFLHAPSGPWSFFYKWNVGEIDGNGNPTPGSDPPYGLWESEPKTLNGNGLPDSFTHNFMLDALAAHGAVILPFSYHMTTTCDPQTGATLTGSVGSPVFHFPGYSPTDSGTTTCPGGIAFWGEMLGSELNSIHQMWPTSKLVVIGHSQGGLVVTKAWQQGFGLTTSSTPVNIQAFTLDSPINGSCGTPLCIGPPTYPDYNQRGTYDEGSGGYLGMDQSRGNNLHFIGTYGDSPVVLGFQSYGSGSETLEHQMPFWYTSVSSTYIESHCNVEAKALVNPQCPAPSPPDHISRCSVDYNGVAQWIQDTGHFVVKYCPDVINYINGVLGLSESPRPSPNPVPANPPADAVAAWNATDGGCASTMGASLRHVADLLPLSDTTQKADLNQFAALPLAELGEGSQSQQAQGQADLRALNKFFGTDRALTTFTGPCSAAPPSTPPSTTPPPTLVSPGNESPADAVDGFYQSELAGDWAAVCSYVTPSAQTLCLSGTSGQPAATGTANVGTMVLSADGNEALVSVTGSLCAPSSPCVSNSDASLGMPPSPSQFPADYQAAVANSTSSSTVLSPMPCSQIGGKWFVDFG
jgi:hypothetical protein